MTRLVALDLPGGEAFVTAVRRVWDAGDAILPVDQRLPASAKADLLAAARPHRIITGDDPDPFHVSRAAPLLDHDDALVVASSGTTGAPKLIVHTRAALTAHARAVHHRLAVDPSRDRWLACLPLAHIGGLGVVLRSILDGVGLDVLPAFDAETVASASERFGSTLTSLVPTALDRIDGSRFRWVVIGGSGDPRNRGANVVRTYGLTETGGGIVYDHLPLPGVRVRVEADGRIGVAGPTLARGRRTPAGEVIPLTGDDGWLVTGDLGRWEERDGTMLLQVDGRADDLIVTGGENVWPQPVEAVLEQHPLVEEAAVYGLPDDEWGAKVVAAVVPSDPSHPPALDDLRAHVRHRLAAFNAPKEVVLVEALPRTAIGKLQRARLLGPEEDQ